MNTRPHRGHFGHGIVLVSCKQPSPPYGGAAMAKETTYTGALMRFRPPDTRVPAWAHCACDQPGADGRLLPGSGAEITFDITR